MKNTKSDFADIYSRWTNTHNEENAISKRCFEEEKDGKRKHTIGELRRMRIQRELDLHNCFLDEALKMTSAFVTECYKEKVRKIRIITGKGLHSENGDAVLRPAIITALQCNPVIMELDTNPKPADGGTGAVIAILKVV